jgi:hypothetical protein
MARSNNSLPAFLLALRQSIVDAEVVSDSCCQIVTEERFLEYSQGQYLVMLIPGVIRPQDQGGEGENETIFEGIVTFRLVSQTTLDVATSDVVALTDTETTTGVYVLFQNLLQVIRFWDECDAQGNSYLAQPMRIASGLSQPRRHATHAQYVWMDVTSEFRICIGTGGSGQ